ncbi:MAG: N-6 DNA methylase [Gemmatimonadota bacterium]|nr:MAG: N-6 DNA methylase [Gemmatimonadota bacterium]
MTQTRAIAAKIVEAIKRAKSETDVQTQFENVLRQYTDETGWELTIRPELKRTIVGAGGADTVLGHVVIAYEKPGKLRESNDTPGNSETIEQLARTITDLSAKERRLLAGVATDGRRILFLFPRRGKFVPTDPRPLSAESVQVFFNTMQALHRKILSPGKLNRDFGPASAVTRLGLTTLYNKLNNASHPKIEMIFREWDRIFGIVYGEKIPQAGQKAKTLAKLYKIEKTVRVKPLLFSVHTYFALFLKLLVAELLGHVKNRSSFTQELSLLEDASLKEKMFSLEEGESFHALGVRNFLEGDLFSWYLVAWDGVVAGMVREVCATLSQYEPPTVSFLPEEVQDLLKKLYQNLIPKKLRHDLGEYHTPDWLAERLLNQVGYEGNPDKRILDPSCGSGTFLVLIINRIRQFLEDHFGRFPDPSVVLNKILNNVVGFELNPLAVITARANYIMALSDLLHDMKGDVQIPVYFTDSILVPQEQIELFSKGYLLQTTVGEFSVPSEIVQANKVDSLTSLLDESVRLQSGVDIFVERARRSCGLDDESFHAAKSSIVELYQTMVNLERQGRNRIWSKIIKNAFAPIYEDRFDYVVGNPPWVNWECLAPEYRMATGKLWEKYELPAKSGGVPFELGKQKRDCALLFTYANIDNYLKDKGRLAFVITQTVLKTQGGEVFRRFQLDKNRPVKVIHVDDVAELQPLEGVPNRTSVLVVQKAASTRYPVPYTLWRKKKGEKISFDKTLAEVMEATQRVKLYARPVDEGNMVSSWITARAKTLIALRKIIGASDYEARAGVCTWANGIYLVGITEKRSDDSVMVENLQNVGKRTIPKVQKPIEPDLLYPVLRGREVSRWFYSSDFYIILPHTEETAWQPIAVVAMETAFPKTFAYLKEFEHILVARSGYVQLRKGQPFYILGNTNPDIYANFKVVWTRVGTDITACVISRKEDRFLNRKTIIPLETVTMVPFEKQDEAHFFCAVLNSSLARIVITTYSSQATGSFGSPHILEHVAIPRFRRSDPGHQELAELSLQAHRLAVLRSGGTVGLPGQGKAEGLFLKEIEEAIDTKVAQLWNITDEELTEIKRSLRELR